VWGLPCCGQLSVVTGEIDHAGSAASAFLAYELAANRCGGLDDRIDRLTEQLSDLRLQIADHEDALTRPSLERMLATLRGRRREMLDDRRAKIDAARARIAETETQLEVLCRERAVAGIGVSQLAQAAQAYRAAFADATRSSNESHDPRLRRLLELADERDQFNRDLRGLATRLQAARTAQRALEAVNEPLVDALAGSGSDLLVTRGRLGPVRRRHLAAATKAAARADRRLMTLRAELVDLEEDPHPTVSLAVAAIARPGAPNIGRYRRNRLIEHALDEVGAWIYRVIRVREKIEHDMAEVHEQLAALDTERGALLA
jgi:chromosome segregation ATPase